MSNIPLRSLTFPGSSNKYIIPVPDETLSLEGTPAGAKAVGDVIKLIGGFISEYSS